MKWFIRHWLLNNQSTALSEPVILNLCQNGVYTVKHFRIIIWKFLPLNKRVVVLASADKVLSRNVGGNSKSSSQQIVYSRYHFIVYTQEFISRTHLYLNADESVFYSKHY